MSDPATIATPESDTNCSNDGVSDSTLFSFDFPKVVTQRESEF